MSDRRPSPRIALALLAVAVLGLPGAGCQSRPAEPQAPRIVGPQLFDCVPDAEDEPVACRHVWQQVDVHPYTRMLNGIPTVDLCSVLRCAKCGEGRHECQRRPRR